MKVVKSPYAAAGSYDVIVDDVKIGTVEKRVESYRGIRSSRGRRLGKYTYWNAYTADRTLIGRSYRRRLEAVGAVLGRREGT